MPRGEEPASAGSLDAAPEDEAQQASHHIAGQVQHLIGASSVLDIADRSDDLVQTLRDAGIEAFGLHALDPSTGGVGNQALSGLNPVVSEGVWTRDYELIILRAPWQDPSASAVEELVELVCSHSKDVLLPGAQLSQSPQRVNSWAAMFARHGFYRDIEYSTAFLPPAAVRFRYATEPDRVIAAYERRLARLEREAEARRDLNIEQYRDLVTITQTRLDLQARQPGLDSTMGWALLQSLQNLRSRVAPSGSVRDQMVEEMWSALQARQGTALAGFLRSAWGQFTWQGRAFLWKQRLRAGPQLRGQVIDVDPVLARVPVEKHHEPVDIVICVHNALQDVRRCLESILQHTPHPYALILVDDGSADQTRRYLSEFAEGNGSVLLRSEEATGYTRAANRGLARATAEYVVLLNSDTVVTPMWLDRLIACMESDPKAGLAGPLSNTASWQSIPYVESNGDWAANPLPEGMTAEKIAALVARYAARSYPLMPFLNGFCLLLSRTMIDEIGHFDETAFGDGYGEEDDLAIRAQSAGWLLALADDAYVYHAHSRSYSSETRKRLSQRAGEALRDKHGQQVIRKGVEECSEGRVLQGIRARSQVMLSRQKWVERGRAAFSGKRILFVLGVAAPGGGGNVVIDEARAMREMGVDARLFNLAIYKSGFEEAYPGLDIPVQYGEEEHLVQLGRAHDAVVATYNPSVQWMAPIAVETGLPVRSYYVQGFEPYIYAPGTEAHQTAWDSYTLFPDLVRFTKTEWTRQEVQEHTGADSHVVGPSVNIDLFRPRPREASDWPQGPIRIAAMIRAGAAYREPELTMELLQRASRRYGDKVELVLFGTSLEDPRFAALPRNFPWKLAGILSQRQVARLLNEVDIFVDFSSHQAMGLTAMEAMLCGAAVIVPECGGAVSFALHGENALVVDTLSDDACWQALESLIDDRGLRLRLQRNALRQVCDFFPERAAFNILQVLFGREGQAGR